MHLGLGRFWALKPFWTEKSWTLEWYASPKVLTVICAKLGGQASPLAHQSKEHVIS